MPSLINSIVERQCKEQICYFAAGCKMNPEGAVMGVQIRTSKLTSSILYCWALNETGLRY